MKKWLIAGAALGGIAALSVWNYRRYMPSPKSFNSQKHAVDVKPFPVQAGEHTLYGELLRPRGAEGPLPTVICCHGFGSSYKLCKATMGMCFAMSGLQVYCFDFYGGSTYSRSGGAMTEMSIFTERSDLSAVIEALKQLPHVDKDNLFLLGESQGGCVAGITAPGCADALKAMILYYPAFCIPDDARKRHLSVDAIPERFKVFDKTVGKIYSENLLNFDVYTEILPFDKPVLIIHGDNDSVVDVSYGQRAAQTYSNAEFVGLAGENHGFSGKGKLEAARLSHAFIQKQMEAR